MVKLLRRLVLLGSAAAGGWLLWSRQQSSSDRAVADTAWPPLRTNTSSRTGTNSGSGAGSGSQSFAGAAAQADTAMRVAADAVAGEATARLDAQAARRDAAAANAATAVAGATADASLDFAAAVAGHANLEVKWVPPNDDGTCPLSHPIKGNDGSKIYHVPEGSSYNRTKAERCYADAADAEADGYRRSKR